MLEQLVVQKRILLEHMRAESEELSKLQKTKNSIDGDIYKLKASLYACNETKLQLEATIAKVQAGYKQMVESGNTLLQLANRSIEGIKNLQSLPAAQMISASVHNMPPPPAITHKDDTATIAQQDVSNDENDLAAQTTRQLKEPFTWYDTDYYNNLS